MKLELIVSNKGDILLKVQFEKAKNFDPQTLAWYPTYKEVESILKTLFQIWRRRINSDGKY